MLIEPHIVDTTYMPSYNRYRIKVEFEIDSSLIGSTYECLYVYVKSNKDKCDMVCPTCGGGLSC